MVQASVADNATIMGRRTIMTGLSNAGILLLNKPYK